MTIEELYKSGVSVYLKEQLDLEYYDKTLSEDKLNFIPLQKNRQCDLQLNNGFGLQYIYVANSFNMDVLNEDNRKTLERLLNADNDGISGDLLEVIIQSFPKAIIPKKLKDKSLTNAFTTYKMSFNPDFVPANALVLYIATQSEYDDAGYIIDKEHEKIKEARLKEIASQMEKNLEGALGSIPIYVFVDYVL